MNNGEENDAAARLAWAAVLLGELVKAVDEVSSAPHNTARRSELGAARNRADAWLSTVRAFIGPATGYDNKRLDIGDIVDVIDKRDGTVAIESMVIERVKFAWPPGTPPGWYASAYNGPAVPIGCCIEVPRIRR